MSSRLLPLLAGLCLVACDGDLGTARGPLDDAEPLAAWEDAATSPAIPADDEPPSVVIEAAVLGEGVLQMRGVAVDDRGVTAMTVRAGLSGPLPVPGGEFARWAIAVPVPPGPIEIEIKAFDEGGRSGAAIYNVDAPAPVDVMPPSIEISAPVEGHETNRPTVLIEGTTRDDQGVVKVVVEGTNGPLGVAVTADHFQSWGLDVPLTPGVTETLTAIATDAAGNSTSARVTVVSRAAPTHEPPEIVGTTPEEGQVVNSARLRFEALVESFAPTVSAAVRIGDGPWRPLSGGPDRWSADLVLAPGNNVLRVVARDIDGLVGRARVNLVVEDGWTDGPRLLLRAPTPPGGRVEMSLDRQAVQELFPVAIQRDTVLLSLDPRAMIGNALNAVRGSCFPSDDSPGCPPTWGGAERNVWRLLTMTAATTDVTGTSLEPAANFTRRFFEAGILPVDFGGLLELALQIEPGTFVLPNEAVVDAVVTQLLATHPGTDEDGNIDVTLEDGLRNMEPLNARLAPTADHPGVLSGARADVLAPNFLMRLVLDSNIRFFEGIDLARGSKRYLADKLPGRVVVDLEFEDPERFAIQGLVDNPGVTFDFGMVEHDAYVQPGQSIAPVPRGRSEAWRIEGWTLERIVAEATYNAFGQLRTPCELCGGVDAGALLFVDAEIGTDLVEVAIGSNGYDCFAGGAECTNGVEPTPRGTPEHFDVLEDPPPGWFRLWVPEGLVRTPPSMYLWDLVLEVAQIRIRDEGVLEGEGDVQFHLEDIPVGLSAAALESGVRAALQSQREDIAERLLGGFSAGNNPLDVYVDSVDGRLWLVATSCLDPLPDADCRETTDAGFYGDAAGELALHSVLPDGRRAMPMAEPGVVYFHADAVVHRLEIETVANAHVVVWGPGATPMRFIALIALVLGCQESSRGVAIETPDVGTPPLPGIEITQPLDHQPHVRDMLVVRGESSNADRIEVFVGDHPPVVAAGTDPWEATVRLPEGEHEVRVVATGPGGELDAAITVYQGRLVTLSQPQPGVDAVELRLDRLALERILSPADQARIVIAHLDLAPLVSNALAALSDPEAWGVDTSNWGDGEWNLAGLLTIGPDSADLEGTALFPILDLSARLGLAQPKVLSDLLDIEPTDRFLAPEILTDSLLDLVVRSHPNFAGDAQGRMAVTLFDALGDLAPLADQYGPSGAHPGFIAAPPRAELFTPAFAMIVSGRGTVTSRPGLRPGEGYAAHLVKPAPGTPLIELDFSDPRRFRVEGLHPEPRVALTMNLSEAPVRFELPPPGSPPRGASAVWTADPWTLERLVAEAGYRAFADLFPAPRTLSYDLGAVANAAQVTWRDGFIEIDVVANLGPPPPPAYLWDLMLDVAQARLHDGGLQEGEVDLRLALPLLPVGLDDEALIAAMRPELDARKEELVALMVGRPEDLDSRATMYLGDDALEAVDTEFFARDDLAGDGRERVPLEPGIWWVRGPDNTRYALVIEGYRDGRLDLGMARVPGAPGEEAP